MANREQSLTTSQSLRLLLACSRSTHDSASERAVHEAIHDGLDWNELVELAILHNTAPLVYKSLRQLGALAPAPALARLQAHLQASTRQNLLLTAELLTLLQRFKTGGITALPFKGPALAMQLYGDLGLRPFEDLDILIAPGDFPRATSLLAASGYQAEVELDARTARDYPRRRHDYRFVRQPNGVIIDLQWGVIQEPFPFPIEIGRLRSRLEPVALGGQTIAAIALDDLLLLLCVHGSKHLWSRLIWVCDIAELIRVRQGLNWAGLMAEARARGSERMCMLGLLLAAELLGAPLPAAVDRWCRSLPAVRALAAEVGAGLRCGAAITNRALEEAPLFYLRMLDRLPSRARLCLRLAPGALRPLVLMRRYGLSPLRHLLGY